MAISVGVFAISRMALRYWASALSSQPSGSYALAAEIPVRSIDIGEVCWARSGISFSRNGESSRSSTRNSVSSSSSSRFGRCVW